MKTFTFEDELVLLEGIKKGLGGEWSRAQDWIKINAKAETVDVLMEPPSSKSIFRQQEIVLSQIPDDGLRKLGSLIGHEMAVFLGKNKRHIAGEGESDE